MGLNIHQSFLKILRERKRQNKAVQSAISDCVENGTDATDGMVHLLEGEAEEFLGQKSLSERERKVSKWILFNIEYEDRKFESIFCDESITIPRRLRNALKKNPEFGEHVAYLRSSIDEVLEEGGTEFDWSHYLPSVDKLEILIRMFPGLLKVKIRLHDLYSYGYSYFPCFVKLLRKYDVDVGELIGDVISRLCYGEYWRGDNDRINVMYEMQ